MGVLGEEIAFNLRRVGRENASMHINRSTQVGFLLHYRKEKYCRFKNLRPLQMVIHSQF